MNDFQEQQATEPELNTSTADDATPGMDNLAAEFNLDPMEERYMGPLLKYLTADRLQDVKEVVMNKPQRIGYEMVDGSWKFIDAPELTLEQLLDAARVLANRAGQIFGPDKPMLACKMPMGHRLQIVTGYNCGTSWSLTLRIQRRKKFTFADFGFDEETSNVIIDAIKKQKTLLISGGTASGKTSFMNVALQYIPLEERLITLEDVPELLLPHENWVQLLFHNDAGEEDDAGVTELLNATLRMRPDRILLGEIRKENAFAFCSAINTGHEGSMATIHANTPKMAMQAVLNRVLMNGDINEAALTVLRNQLDEDIYGVIQLNRVGDRVEGYFEVLNAEGRYAD